ncbi:MULTISPECIES: RES family NAD+ phosphorylase [Micrococcus]|uniref:RES family NAD+ phosphorylase n=1 Tax=Micrococcus TaxID=1269 RepID=UPI0006664E3D|nr:MULTISPECIES: RES domain-containing protein [Micrococcus]MCV7500892.1 RES domain-containing protein [Micrococcus luteus]MCV7540016.1 RES domain-containing protein [Micrococcus luteus]MCV7545272.1 RES domain-containing protein [Micrococcus luteus]MCV7685362.1 RES domain-containing protein [Micrococcus luteus]MCV7731314.1 RES domain-containing protein [Micrococcus luteus]
MTPSPFTAVAGTFYRAVEARFVDSALRGSRSAGRYSPPDAPTLYLSSSPEGVDAAMVAHTDATTPPRELLTFDVHAERIVDLRDAEALAALGVDLAAAMAPWKPAVEVGEEPSSWAVRRRLEEAGAHGLIDPSRTAPGLWHLTLFRWNEDGTPRVTRTL